MLVYISADGTGLFPCSNALVFDLAPCVASRFFASMLIDISTNAACFFKWSVAFLGVFTPLVACCY
jgi:hypothetical protein